MMSDDEEYSDKAMPVLLSEAENDDDPTDEPSLKKQKMILEQERFLPIANISRIMKRNLPSNGKLSKEAKECIQESVSEFISFLASEASDNCAEEKRKTITAEDLLNALRNLGFDNYYDPLKEYLRKYREANKLDKISYGGMGSSNHSAGAHQSHSTSAIKHIEPAIHIPAHPSVNRTHHFAPTTSGVRNIQPASKSVESQTCYEEEMEQRIVQKADHSKATSSASSVGFQSLPIVVDQNTGQQYITVQQSNGHQALWPVQISSSINGAPVFTVSQQIQRDSSSSGGSEAITTANSQMQAQQTVQSTSEMVSTYSVTSSSSNAVSQQVHFINEQQNPSSANKVCNSTPASTNGSSYYNSVSQ
ncbi:hypothetical protein L596_004539 [Steinernema carpocapsae]|uniref:Transcription factor CBF/NF-Y/archaeal histone domain-containing protein n=1 Tax=Steinernema carpocapsae TaxID=34508 RepID=A0A4U8UWA3_STECR|nr:hypothetical protein L596_004539 [Steinernema carpocapsae]